jgi:Transposase zinc-binding domain/Putative transposase
MGCCVGVSRGCVATRATQPRVAFSCKSRGFCPLCLGRKMAQTAAHLVEDVLPAVTQRPWVLTFPCAWRKRLGYDAALVSALTAILAKTVLAFYKQKTDGKSGAVFAVQRTSSDLKLNPHLHAVFLDGTYPQDAAPSAPATETALETAPRFLQLGHLRARDGVVAYDRKQRSGESRFFASGTGTRAKNE